MSKKKNKKKLQKQLIKAQIQASQHAVGKGQAVPVVQLREPTHNETKSTTPTVSPVVSVEKTGEFALIKKDIRFSIILMFMVLISFALIYFFNYQYDFLIKIANWIFQFVQ